MAELSATATKGRILAARGRRYRDGRSSELAAENGRHGIVPEEALAPAGHGVCHSQGETSGGAGIARSLGPAP